MKTAKLYFDINHFNKIKLKDVAILKNGYSFNSKKYTINGKYNIITISNVQGNRFILIDDKTNKLNILPNNLSNHQRLKDFDILISMTGNVGRVSYNKGENNLLNQRVGLIEIISKKIIREYLYQILSCDTFEKEMQINGQGAAQLNISKSDIENYKFYLPNLEEQQKISTFLSAFDLKIEHEFQIIEQLKQLKKSLLYKMFPIENSNVPELRFKGFTDVWEQRKVGDLLIERNQQAPMSDEYPLMAFIANEGVAPKGERYDRSALVTDTVNKLYKKTEKGDFIYSSNNLETGSIGLNKYGKACISPVYSIFEPTGIADSDFLGRRLVRKDFINAMVKWRQGVIYGQWRIHESDFLKIEIPVPSVEEQRKIGAYLDQLDNLITLHQRKYDKLVQVKKALLSKMFV